MKKTAIISECGTYRYLLSRVWDDTISRVLFVVLNPSTADADQDDPTIRRCIGFAKSWGYGGLDVVNMFALRASNPKELLTHPDPVGPDNLKIIEAYFADADTIVVAHGNGNIVRKMRAIMGGELPHVMLPLYKLRVLGRTKCGMPRHPLYVKADAKTTPYYLI